jgi:hypothetical protein
MIKSETMRIEDGNGGVHGKEKRQTGCGVSIPLSCRFPRHNYSLGKLEVRI